MSSGKRVKGRMAFAKVHIEALRGSNRFTWMVSELYFLVCLTVSHLVRCILTRVVIRSVVCMMALVVLRRLHMLRRLRLDIALHDPA